MELVESIGFLVGFLFLLGLFFYLGGVFAKYQNNRGDTKKSFGYQLLQGAIFSLMGLIVAFTFSTANQKMDLRRVLIIDEANAISTAYLRLDLLPDEHQPVMKQYFQQYLETRLATYQALPNLTKAYQAINQSNDIQRKIWEISVKDCKASHDKAVCMVLLPSLNEMFDIANTRIAMASLHPPFVIFYLLIFIALLSAFLAGYDISDKEMNRAMIFIISYIAIIAFTIYIIIDMEYPRLGLIRINSFDVTLKTAVK